MIIYYIFNTVKFDRIHEIWYSIYKGGETNSMEKEREDVIPFETICNNHNHVVFMLQQFKKTGDMWYIDQSIKLIRYCKKQGQHMENRMAKTRAAIESCGFKRIYKVTGKPKKSWQK